LILAFAISLGAGLLNAQDRAVVNHALTADAKAKISSWLDSGGTNTVMFFNGEGDCIKRVPIPNYVLGTDHSLFDFVKKDPIAGCENPKALTPPPPCVVCKDGKIICSRAHFGADSDLEGQGKTAASQPQ
jgi:hypothetical protein